MIPPPLHGFCNNMEHHHKRNKEADQGGPWSLPPLPLEGPKRMLSLYFLNINIFIYPRNQNAQTIMIAYLEAQKE